VRSRALSVIAAVTRADPGGARDLVCFLGRYPLGLRRLGGVEGRSTCADPLGGWAQTLGFVATLFPKELKAGPGSPLLRAMTTSTMVRMVGAMIASDYSLAREAVRAVGKDAKLRGRVEATAKLFPHLRAVGALAALAPAELVPGRPGALISDPRAGQILGYLDWLLLYDPQVGRSATQLLNHPDPAVRASVLAVNSVSALKELVTGDDFLVLQRLGMCEDAESVSVLLRPTEEARLCRDYLLRHPVTDQGSLRRVTAALAAALALGGRDSLGRADEKRDQPRVASLVAQAQSVLFREVHPDVHPAAENVLKALRRGGEPAPDDLAVLAGFADISSLIPTGLLLPFTVAQPEEELVPAQCRPPRLPAQTPTMNGLGIGGSTG
jgi:hypothetical protein